MEDLTKAQLIWLVLLVSFVTSLSTVTVTVSLLEAMPSKPSSQTILQRVVDRVTTPTQHTDASSEKDTIVVVSEEDRVVAVVEEASPAVVSIIATRDLPSFEHVLIDPFSDLFSNFNPEIKEQEIGRGSGFITSSDGTIITNRHVVADTEAAYTVILNNGASYHATVMARDPIHDIAILNIDAQNLPFISLGNSSDIKIGQSIIAIGNALGQFQNTVSVGVISGTGRTVTANGGINGPSDLQRVIQTDAAINPGNSGGPLLNLRGEVIGINTAIITGAENISFAVPSNLITRDIAQVEKYGRITYAFLGIRYRIVTDALAEEQNLPATEGALIISGNTSEPAIVSGSPAADAGLREGDIITEINGIALTQAHHLAERIQESTVGETITLSVLRGTQNLQFSVTLDELPD
ncbi:MAG: hypothetical protein COU90_03365 [Candidatus Ryanbacteria bacterium CG10_big_fil_rev_8_21_14_0_10_43_42]|uniref:PDZ domain-containing protein n=1 Tax=Candidatus Ryanbacteria bacterium CG10_big_fil_rev_8_21_14_0_10_43_42 TaxID=1974864 RepID=A0A2M8KX08_9BACT|nr:MAG: hypothetical protein COU90_03365 [Candidatus Ryanbacteria bacterium CG10_big_fil_rev_8_21_14_0_10_43_42]